MPLNDNTLQALKDFFSKVPLPKHIDLLPGTKITDVPLFLKTQLNLVEHGSLVSKRPAFDRLVRLRQLLEADHPKN